MYNIVIGLRKTVKKSMATGIVQKSCTALFLLWSLKKNNISKTKKKYKDESYIEGILIFKSRKNKNKKDIYPNYALTLKFF